MRWAAMIVGFIILVSVFLPWASVEFYGLSESESGLARSGGLLSLVMGVVCIGLTFLPKPRIRGAGHLVAGFLAIIGVVSYQMSLHSEVGEFAAPLLQEGVGWALCIVAASIVGVIGIIELILGK